MRACAKNKNALIELFIRGGFVKNEHGDLFKQVDDKSLTITFHTEDKNDIWVCTYNQDGNGGDYEMKAFSDVIDMAYQIKDDHAFNM